MKRIPKAKSQSEACGQVQDSAIASADATNGITAPAAEGLLGQALQHEIDHLNGTLFLDRLSRLKRDLYRRRLKKLDREGRQTSSFSINGAGRVRLLPVTGLTLPFFSTGGSLMNFTKPA